MKNRKLNKKGLQVVVVAIGIIATILLFSFIFSNPVDNQNTGNNTVIMGENGEASYFNLSVPSINEKKDSLSLIDKLEQIRLDSVNKSRINTSGLSEIEENKKYDSETRSYQDNYDLKSIQPVQNNNNSYSTGSRTGNQGYSYTDTKQNTQNTNNKPVNKKTDFFKSKQGATKKPKKIDIKNIRILANIHTNQTVKNNERVKFITTKEFEYNNQIFPINTIVYGIAEVRPNRLIIRIDKINQTDMELEVFDSEDSQKGLYVLTPNLNAEMKKEIAKEGIDDQDLSRVPFSRSLRNLFQKSIREEKISLLNGYKVLIKLRIDDDQN